ncbi:MAG: oligosaccharide flippase family protein [Phycisphaerales bacterium]|nr:oligosaccharide flippase family protein [Phycisphaerales bacterium]
MAFVVAGFVLPRIVDRHIGQESLGIWDFGWSILSYFGLAGFGIIGAISRHIARARATQDYEYLRIVTSTGMLIYLCTGTVVAIMAMGTTYALPTLFGQQLGDKVSDAQWVIGLLGLSLVVQFYSAVSMGVLTGSHQWIWYNGISSGVHLVVVFVMICAVLLGYGLRIMAGITLGGEMAAAFLRAIVAWQCCPGLRVSPRYIRRTMAWDMLGYGGKSMIYAVASVFMRETTRILVLGYLGPSALAVYSRPLSLVRNVDAFSTKYSHVFAPTASAYQATHNTRDLQNLMIMAGRYALYLFLPMVIVLTISGRYILQFWMGEQYDSGLVLAILAVGNLPLLVHLASMEIIRGMNRHGLPSLAYLGFATLGIPFAVLVLGYWDWGMAGGALAAVTPLALLYGVFVPIYACRLLNLRVMSYARGSLPGPFAANIPLVLSLFVSRMLWPDSIAANLLGGLGVGILILGVIYWGYVLPQNMRNKVVHAKRGIRNRIFNRRVYQEST